jgi:thiamine pyrophosphokinase
VASGRDVIVLAGGEPVDPCRAPELPHGAMVIAADSGAAAAASLGLTIDLLVGDLDSIAPDLLATLQTAGVPIERHPVDKDRTDLAIALDAALRADPARVTVVGGHGGRLDHLIANALLLASDAYAAVEVVALMGTATITVVRTTQTLTGQPGAYVSLLPVHGGARGVTTSGLRFALHAADLLAGSSLGVSNVFLTSTATVSLDAGVLLAIQPGDPSP